MRENNPVNYMGYKVNYFIKSFLIVIIISKLKYNR